MKLSVQVKSSGNSGIGILRIPQLIPIVLALMLLGLSVLLSQARADTSVSVKATVTPQNISVTVTDGTVSYGTLASGATKDTTAVQGELNDSQTATNLGNIPETLTIKGRNSENWTLGTTAGDNQYTHKFCTANCDSSPSWTGLTTSYQTLGSNVAANGVVIFDLQIGTPTNTSAFSPQSVDVTVMATSS